MGTPYELAKLDSIVRGDYQPFPELIDNTARSNWVKCPYYFYRGTIQELRLRLGGNIHLSAGGALAAGLEAARRAYYERQIDPLQAEEIGVQAAIDAYPADIDLAPAKSGDKSIDNVVKALRSYLNEYPLASDDFEPVYSAGGRRGIEFSFAQVIPGIVHPETGNPMLYGGRFDMLAQRRMERARSNASVYVCDEKSSTALGDAWKQQWDLDAQPMGYVWASRSYGYPVVGALIRGIGLLKTKITHVEVIRLYSTWMIDRWLEQLQYDVEDMIRAWKRKYYRRALDKFQCAAYGGCTFKTMCESPNPDAWVAPNYSVVHWNPTKREIENIAAREAEDQAQVEEYLGRVQKLNGYLP